MKRRQPVRSIAFCGILFCCFLSRAQGIITDKDNEFDKKYTPAHNSVFNGLNKKNTQSPSSSNIEIKNSIKFCPTLLVRQKLGFYYEREITSGLALNLGLGKAFGRDIFEAVFFDAFGSQAYPYAATPGLMLNNCEFDGSSPFVSAGFRLYYAGTTFDGGYIEGNYRHETVNYILKETMNGYRVEGARNATFTMNAFNFGFGYTGITGQKNNITHDFFMSFGIKLFSYTRFDQFDSPQPYGGTEKVYRVSGTELSARIAPSINISYSFGFGF